MVNISSPLMNGPSSSRSFRSSPLFFTLTLVAMTSALVLAAYAMSLDADESILDLQQFHKIPQGGPMFQMLATAPGATSPSGPTTTRYIDTVGYKNLIADCNKDPNCMSIAYQDTQ